MKQSSILLSLLALSLLISSVSSSLSFEQAFPNLPAFDRPVGIESVPGEDGARIFVLQQYGLILVFENSDSVSTRDTFLDLTGVVEAGGEMGLLGMAFHPNYVNNGRFFLYYNVAEDETRIVEYAVSTGNPNQANPTPVQVILSVDQPYSNHNGGQLSFGPDGYLYLGLGDGGGPQDPDNNAQNTNSILGKILRIDVDTGDPYGIPASNPFATGGGAPEVFVWGLRNPWRFSFDSQTGDLWIGDVGESEREEISVVKAPNNLGWKRREGCDCFDGPCSQGDSLLPIHEYAHIDGGRSVTGGYVYRDSAVPSISNRYVFGDFVTGEIFTLPLNYSPNCGTSATLMVNANDLGAGLISTFGYVDGEIYFASLISNFIYRLVEIDSTPTPVPSPSRSSPPKQESSDSDSKNSPSSNDRDSSSSQDKSSDAVSSMYSIAAVYICLFVAFWLIVM